MTTTLKLKPITSFDKYYIYDVIRKNIIKFRADLKITQKDLAAGIGHSEDYITEIESPTKKKTFSLAIVFKISIFMQIPIEDFFKMEDVWIRLWYDIIKKEMEYYYGESRCYRIIINNDWTFYYLVW